MNQAYGVLMLSLSGFIPLNILNKTLHCPVSEFPVEAACWIATLKSISQSISLIATLWPESRIGNDMQLK